MIIVDSLGDKTVVIHYNEFWKMVEVDLTHKDYVCGKIVNNREIYANY